MNIIEYKNATSRALDKTGHNSSLSVREADMMIECHRLHMTPAGASQAIVEAREKEEKSREMTPAKMAVYLVTEAKKLFPQAGRISAFFHDELEESIITMDGENYKCEAGSDDDNFVFTSDRTGEQFTIPLPPA